MVSNLFLCSISYMGCHPKPIEKICFRGIETTNQVCSVGAMNSMLSWLTIVKGCRCIELVDGGRLTFKATATGAPPCTTSCYSQPLRFTESPRVLQGNIRKHIRNSKMPTASILLQTSMLQEGRLKESLNWLKHVET
jgi:hypothetical protein